MTKLPGKPALPFTPTTDERGNPTTCRCCGMLAFGIGRATPHSKDPGFMCKPCMVAAGDLTKLDRVSLYEVKALESGVEAVGQWLSEKGITDLALMDELDAKLLVRAAWEGCARGVREALREAPF
ncbi:p098 [Rhizobium phage 16-3]|uniref:p098 n=1 Tax=Rhizobium phage 16-3 TaxID=10704 RepID=UPI00017BA65B|nr:p098 [Rhizobium phage 16-3]ABF71345.1 p098 [Rhizobium phage 16-3]